MCGSKEFVLVERGEAFKNSLKEFNFIEYNNLSQWVKEYSKELDELQLPADWVTASSVIDPKGDTL